MHILVTGGSGFIGRWLCKKLLGQGHHVYCIDNLQSSTRDNINEFCNNERFKFYEKDVCEILDGSIEFEKLDQIYHLACPASPVHYQSTPIKTLDTCYTGTSNVLVLANKYGARILYTSTSEIYGDPLKHPQQETYNGNVNPRSSRACYDEGKRIGETLVTEYHRKYGVENRVVRIFNTYGPYLNEKDGRVVSNFITQSLQDLPITVYGDGSQTRSFCYVQDMVDGLVCVMNTDNPVLNTKSVNIGNPEERTILNTAEIIMQKTKSLSKIEYHELPDADPLLRRPDIGLIKELCGWTPTTNFDEGIQKTIDHFKSK
jgi:UDP-glucuronate decarboxylase